MEGRLSPKCKKAAQLLADLHEDLGLIRYPTRPTVRETCGGPAVRWTGLINNRGGRRQAALAAVPAHEAVQLIRGCSRAPDAATSLPATAATVTALRSFGPRGSGGLPLSGRGGRGDHDFVGPHPGGTR
jgi:hypothetical protein